MRLFKRGRTYYVYIYENGRRIQRSTRCHDKQAAEAVARKLERDAADPDHARTRGATLSDAFGLLLRTREEEARAGRRATATVTFYRSKAGHWIRVLEHDRAGQYRPFLLAGLAPRHVDQYVSTRRAEQASEHTIHKEIVTLRVALKLAKRAEIWRGDVERLLPVAFAPAYKARERWLPPAEAQRLLAELLPDHAARVALILATSASWGESDRVERADIASDLSAVHLRGTKTATRDRVVPIVTDRQRALLRYALAHAEGKSARLFRAWSNVRHDLEAACRRAKIDRCSPNDLRRSFAHWMRAEHFPLELISPCMGHATTKMLELVYGKLSADELATLLQACITGASPRLPPGALDAQAGSNKGRKTQGISFPWTESNRPHEDFQSPAELWPNPRKSAGNAGSFLPRSQERYAAASRVGQVNQQAARSA